MPPKKAEREGVKIPMVNPSKSPDNFKTDSLIPERFNSISGAVIGELKDAGINSSTIILSQKKPSVSGSTQID